jgi:hypothetical protein
MDSLLETLGLIAMILAAPVAILLLHHGGDLLDAIATRIRGNRKDNSDD